MTIRFQNLKGDQDAEKAVRKVYGSPSKKAHCLARKLLKGEYMGSFKPQSAVQSVKRNKEKSNT